MRRRTHWLQLALFCALIFLAACVLTRPAPQLPPVNERSIYPQGTPSPSGFVPGIYLARGLFDQGGVTLTPDARVAGVHLDIYWSNVQPNLTVTPDWRGVETQVAYAAANGLQSWLSLQAFQTNPTPNQPDVFTVPTGLPTVAYNGVGASCATTEYGQNYGATTYRNAVATVESSLAAKFGNDSRVAGFALQIGASGEAWGVQDDATCAKKAYFETPVPCQSYLDAVELAAKWLRAGTNKPISLAAGVNSCSPSNAWMNEGRKATKRFFDDLNLTPTVIAPGTPAYIGYRYNGLMPDDPQSFYSTPTPGPYGHYQYAHVYPDNGGVFYEPKNYPAVVPTADAVGYSDYMLLNAASAHADAIFLQKEWLAYIEADVLNVVTQTLGTTAANSPLAWVWFRGAETANIQDNSYTYHSGDPNPFTHLAQVVGNATPTTYCSPSVRATQQAYGGSNPPYACTNSLSTPVAPESRNALGYQAGSSVAIDIDDAWQYADATDNNYVVSLRYLDTSGTLIVAWKNAGGGESTYEITKSNSETWVTDTFTMTGALADGYTTHDIEIRPGGALAILNSLVIVYDSVSTGPTATPTQTLTPSATPANTRTPRPTATFVTATVTRTPTATPDWVTLNCPAITPTVDGDLAEWASVTPVALNSTSATVIQPPTPSLNGSPTPTGTPAPQSADLSGTLYCGYAENVLYFAGTVTDETVTEGTTYSTVGSIGNGDAVRITLDGNRDGLANVRGDDHDLYITPAGRVLDFDTYPISTTVSAIAIAGGWRFELALDASALGIATPVSGDKWGLVWHLLDADTANGIEHIFDDRKRMATIP